MGKSSGVNSAKTTVLFKYKDDNEKILAERRYKNIFAEDLKRIRGKRWTRTIFSSSIHDKNV